jgi:hypothetical protein
MQQIDKAFHTTMSSRECGQQTLGSRKIPSPWGIAQPVIKNDACRGETMRDTLLKEGRERAIDRAFRCERDLSTEITS